MRSYYRCCINEPGTFSHLVHHKLGHCSREITAWKGQGGFTFTFHKKSGHQGNLRLDFGLWESGRVRAQVDTTAMQRKGTASRCREKWQFLKDITAMAEGIDGNCRRVISGLNWCRALLKVCSNRDDTVPLRMKFYWRVHR